MDAFKANWKSQLTLTDPIEWKWASVGMHWGLWNAGPVSLHPPPPQSKAFETLTLEISEEGQDTLIPGYFYRVWSAYVATTSSVLGQNIFGKLNC